MQKHYDIHKAGGILLKDRKLLIERSTGKDYFIAPGGTREEGERIEDTLIRELREEFSIEVTPGDFHPFGTFYAAAAGNKEKVIRMDVFTINHWVGEPTPSSEVEEIMWTNSNIPEGTKVGSIFEHEVIPRLREQNLID